VSNSIYADLIDIDKVAGLAEVTVHSVRVWHRKGRMPRPVVGGGHGHQLLWSRREVTAWLATRQTS
jgi:hypothetical protein